MDRKQPQGKNRAEPRIRASTRRDEAAQTQARPRSRRRLWLFRGVAVFVVPALLLGGLEVALRLAGFGYPTRFYLNVKSDGAAVCVQNNDFARRYFPPGLQRYPFPFRIPNPKPQGAARIFVLGSSAALGDPEPLFSFGRILEAQLRARHPGVEFEVVNAAMTAINSHVVRDIAADCAALQPDAYVVYMGNNEVVGPFGAGTAFGPATPNLTLARASLALRRTRVGQLVGRVVDALRTTPDRSTWQGLEMFLHNQVAADDPSLQRVYAHFQTNLECICRQAEARGIPVILCTVATNLRDCAPFATRNRPDLGTEDKRLWDECCEAGRQREAAGEWPAALQAYEQAARLDDREANLQYRLGRVYEALGDFGAAREHYVRARDYDWLRFRADTHINEIVRTVAADRNASNVHLVDAAHRFEERSPNGLPGAELFLDHVHLTFAGNCLLARAVLDELGAHLPAWIQARPPAPTLTDEQVADDVAFTEWDRFQIATRVLDGYLRRPPFTNQLDHAQTLARREQQVHAMGAGLTEAALGRVDETFREALRRRPNDDRLHFAYGRFLAATGALPAAAEQMRTAVRLFPDYHPDLLNELAVVLARLGRFDEARPYFERALRLLPDNASNHCNYAIALAEAGDLKAALAMSEHALHLNPTDPVTQRSLAQILQRAGRLPEALEHFRQAVRLEPDDPEGYLHLGTALASAGALDDALAALQQALALAPDWPPARQALAAVSARRSAAQTQSAPAGGP